MWKFWGCVSAPGGWRVWRWTEGYGGHDALEVAGGDKTSLWAAQQAGRKEAPQAGTGKTP